MTAEKLTVTAWCTNSEPLVFSVIFYKTESDKPKKFKVVLQKFLYENSFYSVDEYFELHKR